MYCIYIQELGLNNETSIRHSSDQSLGRLDIMHIVTSGVKFLEKSNTCSAEIFDVQIVAK